MHQHLFFDKMMLHCGLALEKSTLYTVTFEEYSSLNFTSISFRFNCVGV